MTFFKPCRLLFVAQSKEVQLKFMFFICIALVQRSRQKAQSGDAKVGTQV